MIGASDSMTMQTMTMMTTQVLAKFPRTTIVASDLDPCLDENVQFSSMLYEAGAQVLTESDDF